MTQKEKEDSNFQLARKAVLDAFIIVLSKPAVRKAAAKNLSTMTIFGGDGKPAEKAKLSKDELAIQRIFTGFYEIHATYDALVESEHYLRQFPRIEEVSRARWLQREIMLYREECYILCERLESF